MGVPLLALGSASMSVYSVKFCHPSLAHTSMLVLRSQWVTSPQCLTD